MDNKVKCPRCNSTNVYTGNKGYGLVKGVTGGLILGPIGLLAGTIGSKRIRIDCLLCGHHWDLIKQLKAEKTEAELRALGNDMKDLWDKTSNDKQAKANLRMNVLTIVLVISLLLAFLK